MTKMLDVLESARRCVEEAGVSPVSLALADAYRFPEATVIRQGAPLPGKRYWDGTGTDKLRLTVIVKRISEEAAIAAACAASAALNRSGAAESLNGSYRLVSNSAETPRQLPWDEQGRWVCAFDATIEYEKE